jgi:hypothetical protein
MNKSKLVDPAAVPTADPDTAPTADSDAVPPTATPNPFDIASLRLNPSFFETAGVKKLVTTVPVRKPGKQDFIRVRPEPEYRDNFGMIELKDDREEYLVSPVIIQELAGEVVFKTVFTAIDRQGIPFLWPVRLPAPDERKTEWPRSEREAAERAMTQWVRVKANMKLGAYEMFVAESVMADPVWPKLSYQELVQIAFRDRLITSIDHPVVKRLRGLA